MGNFFENFKIVEPPPGMLSPRERRMEEILRCGVKPVCANCDNLIDRGGEDYDCKARPGIIPKSCADNLTCIYSHGEPNFRPRKETL